MKTPYTFSILLGTLALAGCLETTPVSAPANTVPLTGGNLTGTTATNCKAAIARQTGKSTRDVAIFDVSESEAGNQAQASVAGAEKPWICLTDRNGRVNQVMYSGEG